MVQARAAISSRHTKTFLSDSSLRRILNSCAGSNFVGTNRHLRMASHSARRKKLARESSGCRIQAETQSRNRHSLTIAMRRQALRSFSLRSWPCKKMIGFESPPLGRFREYAGNQASRQFLGTRGCNGRFGAFTRRISEVSELCLHLGTGKEKHPPVPVIDVSITIHAGKTRDPVQTVNKNFRFAFVTYRDDTGPKSANIGARLPRFFRWPNASSNYGLAGFSLAVTIHRNGPASN